MDLNLDDQGECHVLSGDPYERAESAAELGKIEKALGVIDVTLESTCDEVYSARKEAGFGKAGISFLHVEIEPDEASIN